MSTAFLYFQNENLPAVIYNKTMVLGMMAERFGASGGGTRISHIPDTLEFEARGFQNLEQAEKFVKHVINHKACEFIDWFDLE